MTGTTQLGYNNGDTWGLGDTQVSTIVRVYRDRINQVTVNFGLSLPTGSTTETTNFLIPTGARPTARAFYVLQTGTGTVDAMPGITYSGVLNRWSWAPATAAGCRSTTIPRAIAGAIITRSTSGAAIPGRPAWRPPCA